MMDIMPFMISPIVGGGALALTLASAFVYVAFKAQRRSSVADALEPMQIAAGPHMTSVTCDGMNGNPKRRGDPGASGRPTPHTMGPPPSGQDADRTSSSAGHMRSSGILLGANLLEAILPFVRNIVLVRLISPDEFGLAISLSIVLGMIEVLTDFGLPIFAVRRTTPLPAAETMMTLQSLALIRSAVLGVLLVVAAPVTAWAFYAPDAVPFYALLGLIAFLRGFENLSVKEQMRRSVFWREATVIAASNVVLTVVTLVAAALTGSFECMLWGMLAGTIAVVVLSHALAPRRFRLGWSPVAVSDATRFGGPLLINGTAVALGTSDRLMVASLFGPAALAMYNVAIGTAMLPRSILAKFLTAFFVPLFVKAQKDRVLKCRLSDTWAWCLSCLAFTYGMGLALLGDRVLGFVFGPSYQPSRVFMVIAGLNVCIKFLMMLPVPGAYAAGHTKRISEGATLSALAILPGFGAAFLSDNLSLFLFTITAAEFIALLWFTTRACQDRSFSRRLVWPLIAAPVTLLSGLILTAHLWPDLTFGLWALVILALLLVGAVFYRVATRLGGVVMSVLH